MPVDLARFGTAESETALGELVVKVGERLLTEVGAGERELSIVLTDDSHIRTLNQQWRGEDKPTDVLSFPLDDPEVGAAPTAMPASAQPLGDIVISVETASVAATRIGEAPERHIVFLLIHGFCHLLGHDHADKEAAARMRALEDRLLAAVAPTQKRPPTPY